MHPPLKPEILFYSNGLAILSSFHDIPQHILIEFRCTNVINWQVLLQHLGQGTVIEYCFTSFSAQALSSCKYCDRRKPKMSHSH